MYLSWYTVKIVYMVNGFVQYIYPNLSVLQYLIKYAENSSFPLKRDVFSARQEQILPKTISQLLQKICEGRCRQETFSVSHEKGLKFPISLVLRLTMNNSIKTYMSSGGFFSGERFKKHEIYHRFGQFRIFGCRCS